MLPWVYIFHLALLGIHEGILRRVDFGEYIRIGDFLCRPFLRGLCELPQLNISLELNHRHTCTVTYISLVPSNELFS